MPAKKTNSTGKVKIRGDREFADNLNETDHRFVPENPIKRQIKINQLPWTDKQKEFFEEIVRIMLIQIFNRKLFLSYFLMYFRRG